MISAISVKDRLKKQAIEEKKTMQDKIVMYGLERTIYRLSISEYAERFTLKGGIFLYALFNGKELTNAIKETFNHRGTSFDDIVAFEDGFADDKTRLMRWNSFVKKKKALVKLSFEETVQLLKILLFPIVDAIKKDELFEHSWSHEKKMWR